VKPQCARCRDCGWVCENHPDTPWQGAHAIECGAGMPCPDCNQPNEGELPRLPFTPELAKRNPPSTLPPVTDLAP